MQAPLTRTQWLICIIAAIGFAFDTYELMMLPLIIKPALASLGGFLPGSEDFSRWGKMLFFIPAIAGGIFGLLGGWLTDRLGRRRVLTWSILIYAFGAFASGFSTNLVQFLICRCFVFVGVCVEFVAAVAWLAEIFPNPQRREKILGYTQAFSSLGGILVALTYGLLVRYAADLPAIYGSHDAWRYTLISGLLPAIPLIIIRPFLPESPTWLAKKQAGTLRRPSITELFQPALRRTTLLTTALFACCYGIAFGAILHLPQMVPGFADVKAEVSAAQTTLVQKLQTTNPPTKPSPKELTLLQKTVEQKTTASVQTWQELGGLSGRLLLALAAVRILQSRILLQIFLVPALLFIPSFFWWMGSHLQTPETLSAIKWGIFTAGLLLVGQFSFWGNYIPRVFPLHLRGTGESFAANIGGRVIGTSMAWVFFSLSASNPPNPTLLTNTAGNIAFVLSALALILSFFLPKPLPEDTET